MGAPVHTHSCPLGSWHEQNSSHSGSLPQALSYHPGNVFLRIPPEIWFWAMLITSSMLRHGPWVLTAGINCEKDQILPSRHFTLLSVSRK